MAELTADEQVVYNTLYTKYGRTNITKPELADELGIGLSTVSKLMASGRAPNHTKMGNSFNSRVIFALPDVARFIVNGIKL